MLSLLLAASLVSVSVESPPINFLRVALAVEAVEAGAEKNPWAKPGGKANWSRRTWAQYSALPYEAAKVPEHSREAMIHAFHDFSRRLLDRGVTPTIWRLASAYLLGFDGSLVARRTPDDYGSRAEALVLERRPR